MKKLLFIPLFIIFISMNTFAQESDVKLKNEFKFSLLNFTVGNFQIGFERALQIDKSLAFNIGYTQVDNWSKREGVNIELQFKYFLYEWEKPKSIRKIYFAPYLGYKYFDVEYENYYWENDDYMEDVEQFDVHAINAGIVVGYKFILNRRLVFDAYVGGGIRKATDNEDYQSEIFEPGYNGIAPKIGFDLGFNF